MTTLDRLMFDYPYPHEMSRDQLENARQVLLQAVAANKKLTPRIYNYWHHVNHAHMGAVNRYETNLPL